MAEQLCLSQVWHGKLRREVADHLSQHHTKYQPFLDEPLDNYVTDLRKESSWAGELELTALCTLYKYVRFSQKNILLF